MTDVDVPNRALITEAAADLLRTLQDRHGALMFHQSGGCCDGSSPMCYPNGDFIVGDRDVQLVIDVVPGRGGGFSLEAPEGKRFLSRGRAFTTDENEALNVVAPVTGTAYERGERPPANGTHLVADAVDACAIPMK